MVCWAEQKTTFLGYGNSNHIRDGIDVALTKKRAYETDVILIHLVGFECTHSTGVKICVG